MTLDVKVALNPNTTNQQFFINSLPNDKFLNWSKLKTFADNKLNLVEKFISVLVRVENIVGKGNQHFLCFPQCFQKTSLSGLSKVRIVW